MNGIGDILTAADLKQIQRESEKSFSSRGYVAPTVYRYAGGTNARWPYWNSFDEVVASLPFFLGIPGATLKQPASNVIFANDTKAQTLGINCDFYYKLPTIGWVNVPYPVLKSIYQQNLVIPFRFFKTDGSGPFYSVLINTKLGISATVVNTSDPAKVRALDEFHRQVQLLRGQYNALATYLNTLAKRQLNPVEQQSFNEGLLLYQRMQADVKSIPGVQFLYASNGTISGIGVVPVVLYIVLAIITSIAAAWTIERVATERQKTARINSAYNIQKWLSDQAVKVAEAKSAGKISSEDANRIFSDLQTASQAAQGNAKEASSNAGFFDKLENLALLGIAALVISKA